MVNLAFVGDVHGQIYDMYRELSAAEDALSDPINCVIQVGDFHAIRHLRDLNHFPAKAHHKSLGDFPNINKAGRVERPTCFIGGNHENFHWLDSYPDGHLLVENLRYLGRAGVQTIGDVRIGWVSGNYSPKAYQSPKSPPKGGHFTPADIEHILTQGPVDVLVFHDWPSMQKLEELIDPSTVSDPDVLTMAIRRKLGSDPLFEVLKATKPRYVFCGHMHQYLSFDARIEDQKVSFVALDKMGNGQDVCVLNTSNWTVAYLNAPTGSFLSILPFCDRKVAEHGLRALAANQFAIAQQRFDKLVASQSPESQSIGNYGLGVMIIKQSSLNQPSVMGTLDDAISRLQRSLDVLEHADAFLILGQALIAKAHSLAEAKKSDEIPHNQIPVLYTQALEAFESAIKLNPEYGSVLDKDLTQLRAQRNALVERIRSFG